jgi:hypothetical protein
VKRGSTTISLAPLILGFTDPRHGRRVVFSGVRSIHHDDIGILQVDPVIGHRPTP